MLNMGWLKIDLIFCFAQQLSYSGTEIGDFQDKFNGSNSNDPGTLRCYYTKHYFKGKLNI